MKPILFLVTWAKILPNAIFPILNHPATILKQKIQKLFGYWFWRTFFFNLHTSISTTISITVITTLATTILTASIAFPHIYSLSSNTTWSITTIGIARWARKTKNPDCSTGPLAHPFPHSLAPLTCSLAHFAYSLTRGTVNDSMAIFSVFFPVFTHSA